VNRIAMSLRQSQSRSYFKERYFSFKSTSFQWLLTPVPSSTTETRFLEAYSLPDGESSLIELNAILGRNGKTEVYVRPR
jgi:hypothetical protein